MGNSKDAGASSSGKSSKASLAQPTNTKTQSTNTKAQSPNTADPSADSGSSSNNNRAADSTYRVVKDGWGDRKNFQLSYGLRMTPEDLEEGSAILRAMREQDGRQEERR